MAGTAAARNGVRSLTSQPAWRATMHETYGFLFSINDAELWAESFAAYTSPLYKMGSLPKEIESLLEKNLGR